MNAILTDPHLDTRINSYIVMIVIVPKLDYAGEVWGGNAKFGQQLKMYRWQQLKYPRMLKYDK